MRTIVLILLMSTTAVATQERVPRPDDLGKRHLTVFGEPGTAQFANVKRIMRGDAMKGIIADTHYREIGTDETIYQELFAPHSTAISGETSVWYQTSGPESRVLLKTTGINIPVTSEQMAEFILRCPKRRRSSPPAVQPVPEPDVFSPPSVEVTVQPDVIPPAPSFPVGVLVLVVVVCVVVGAVVGVIKGFRDQFRG